MSSVAAKPKPASGRFAFLRYMEVNPVLIKDLRQAAHSWTVIGSVMLMMVVFYFIAVAFLLNGEFSDRSRNYMGPALYGSVSIVMMITTFCFIPIYVGIRTMLERTSINADLLYITTMSPARIIRGKFISGVYLVLLFYSAAVPFMVFSYLLRGIDLPTIGLSIGLFFLVNIMLIQGAITLATTPLSIVFKILIALFLGIPAIIIAIFFCIAGGIYEISGMLGRLDFWKEFVPVAGMLLMDGALFTGLMYQAAVAFVTPTSANRSLPFRRYFTFMWLLLGIQFIIWGWVIEEDEVILTFLIGTGILVFLGIWFGIGGRDDLSARVRKQIPESIISRSFAFYFYNGTFSCLLWLMGIWMGTMVMVGICNFFWSQYLTRSFLGNDPELTYLGTSLFILYAFAYALFSIWLQRRWLSRITPKLACLFFFVLTVIPYILIQILSLIVTQDSIDSDIPLPGVILDLFKIFDHYSRFGEHLYYHLAAVLVLIGFGLLLNLKWIQSQITQFTPFTKSTTNLPSPSQPEPHAGEPPPIIS
ncbi:MAG: hypothetical protein QF685_13120 [Verrucomicrobiota bacterium]|jgi:hypothetical protein|nr:hypothetical protein [Verrucomicrobiota bacterium]